MRAYGYYSVHRSSPIARAPINQFNDQLHFGPSACGRCIPIYGERVLDLDRKEIVRRCAVRLCISLSSLPDCETENMPIKTLIGNYTHAHTIYLFSERDTIAHNVFIDHICFYLGQWGMGMPQEVRVLRALGLLMKWVRSFAYRHKQTASALRFEQHNSVGLVPPMIVGLHTISFSGLHWCAPPGAIAGAIALAAAATDGTTTSSTTHITTALAMVFDWYKYNFLDQDWSETLR